MADFEVADDPARSTAIDRPDTTLAFTEAANHTHGTLTVMDGTNIANITLLGPYVAADFTLSEFNGGTVNHRPAAKYHQRQLANPHG